jgi:uncharacterized protein YyaL (SSP411 family)
MSENLLRHEASPYLLQHKDNPVHWHAWGPEAFAEARATGRPVLLSVGYAACHWCHVMAHESFEDPAIAAVMNRLFVNIKVDREERPDVDQIYMAALHALGEQGGWPLTMFMTPAGEPIWGGTYFPPTARYGRPGFVQVLEEVSRLFREEPDKIAGNRRYIMERLAPRPRRAGRAPDAQLLDAASERLLELMDTVNGGPRGAPKFPNTALIELLWRAGLRKGEGAYRDVVLLTLRAIAQGGIYDHVGGGFARYATDEHWLVPHFEKMLYDNAQLVELMSYAFVATGDPLFRDRVGETIAWLEREMLTGEGAFAASLDADSEGHEGKFYVWTQREVMDVLGIEDGAFFSGIYDITPAGNWEAGVSIANRGRAKRRLSEADEARLASARTRLLARRSTRVRPATDDKVLADWNGLTIAALALAGSTFGERAWIALAERAFDFVTGPMSRAGRLAHSWRGGKSVFPGLASDNAAMIKAALALHAATLDQKYVAEAERLAALARAHHWDNSAPGYFLSADDAEALIIRPRATSDEATPSATGVMAQNLIRLWRLTGNDDYRRDADDILAANAPAIAGNLFASTSLANALDLRLAVTDVVIVAPAGEDPTPLLGVARAHWSPNLVLAVHRDATSMPPGHPANGKTAVDGKPTAYVCRGETCSLPVTDGEGLAALLVPPPA